MTLPEIGSNVLLTVMGIFVGWLLPVLRQRIRTYRARRFWRPFSRAERLRVVVGKFDEFEAFERSGFVGVGDVEALTELQAIWSDNHLGQLRERYVGNSASEDLPNDLILIGGPDANWVTRAVLDQRGGVLELGDPSRHVVSITDNTTGLRYSPAQTGHDHETDWGVIKMGPNPWEPTRHVLIIAGAFGIGTWAGPQLLRQKEFLMNPVVRSGQPFECLYKVDAVRGVPVRTTLELLYPINANAKRA